MNQSQTIGKLAASLAKAQSGFRSAERNSKNYYGTGYSSMESLWSAARGPLIENGLAIIQGNRVPENADLARQGVIVVTRLIHESGEWIETELYIPAIRREKKKGAREGLGSDPDGQEDARRQAPDAQAFGAANSYGRRIALQAILGIISAEEDDDELGLPASTPDRASTRPAVRPMSFDRARDDLAALTTTKGIFQWRTRWTREIGASPDKKAIQEAFTARVEAIKRAEAAFQRAA
ncbi:MAG: ERF family protein [Syntrophobacteraceae bacterium]